MMRFDVAGHCYRADRAVGANFGSGQDDAHLIDCLGTFVPERWTEYETKSKDAACLSLS